MPWSMDTPKKYVSEKVQNMSTSKHMNIHVKKHPQNVPKNDELSESDSTQTT